MTKKPQVSVIIPSFNSEPYIRRCLSSLFSQKASPGYEIILVDSSRDKTPQIVRENYPEVRLIYLEKQTMPGAARNIGIREAEAGVTAFIDSDCVAAPDWIESVMAAINQGYSIVGGAVRNGNPENIIGYADYFISFSEFFPGMPRREITTVMATCNFVCRKEVFNHVGGFHPQWLTGEDYLFCSTASKRYRLLFDPRMTVFHVNREGFKPFSRHQYNYGQYSARIRKMLRLPGNIFVRFPLLSLFLPFIRFQRISSRVIRWNRNLLFPFLLASPFILLGLLVWEYGFFKKCLINHSG